MTDAASPPELARLATGIPGFDDVSYGGLPAGAATLVTGTVGSGKTVFALQYLAEGIRRFGQHGVFVTFGEPAGKLRRFVVEFGWDLAAWEADGRWAFVDGTVGPDEVTVVIGERVDLTILLNRIAAAVARTGATRVAIDSLGVLFARYGDTDAVRDGFLRVVAGLERLGVTTVITIGRDERAGGFTEYGVEEYVADALVILRNELSEEARRRTLEVLKFRGTHHRQGQFPFAINRELGVVVIPLAVTLDQPSSTRRIASGIPELDQMCGGGLFEGSVALVSGSTGTGKTTLALRFALAGAQRGEPAVVVGFEESRDQLVRGVAGWDVDVAALEADAKLRFVVDYPEVRTFEEHLVRIQAAVDEIGASRLVVDSLTSLRRSGPERSFREFALGLAAYAKQHRVATVLTTGQTALVGPEVAASQEHVSALSDAVVLLRYVEVYGDVRRGISVLKLRGSSHDTAIRAYTIGPDGLRIGEVLRTTTGILSGRPTQLDSAESARVATMFTETPAPSDPLTG